MQNGKDWTDDTENWQHIKDISTNLETLYLSGGEPLLLENHVDLLQHLVDTGVASNIWLKTHTNGTKRLDDKLLSLLKQFKSVRLMYSIDDIGERFEYQRPPVKWSKVRDNFVAAMQHDWLDLRITYTISLLNCLSGTEFTDWCNDIGFPLEHVEVNFLRYPIYYELGILSDQQKEFLLKHIGDTDLDQKVKKYMNTQFWPSVVNKDWQINSRSDLDKLRRYAILSIDKKKQLDLGRVSPVIAELVDGRYLDNK